MSDRLMLAHFFRQAVPRSPICNFRLVHPLFRALDSQVAVRTNGDRLHATDLKCPTREGLPVIGSEAVQLETSGRCCECHTS